MGLHQLPRSELSYEHLRILRVHSAARIAQPAGQASHLVRPGAAESSATARPLVRQDSIERSVQHLGPPSGPNRFPPRALRPAIASESPPRGPHPPADATPRSRPRPPAVTPRPHARHPPPGGGPHGPGPRATARAFRVAAGAARAHGPVSQAQLGGGGGRSPTSPHVPPHHASAVAGAHAPPGPLQAQPGCHAAGGGGGAALLRGGRGGKRWL